MLRITLSISSITRAKFGRAADRPVSRKSEYSDELTNKFCHATTRFDTNFVKHKVRSRMFRFLHALEDAQLETETANKIEYTQYGTRVSSR